MSRRGGSNKPNTFAIPLAIVIAAIILILIFKGVSNMLANDANPSKEAGQSYALVTPYPEAKIGIIMPSSDSPTEIKEPSKLFATDKMLRVIEGGGEVTIENSSTKILVETLTELGYLGKKQELESFQLYNGYAWIEAGKTDNQITLKHFTVKPSVSSIFIVNQNTLASNVYVLSGEVEVQGEKSTAQVRARQMLSVLKSQSTSNNFGEMIGVLDDNIKLSNIYTKNKGDTILATATQPITQSGSESSTATGASLSGSISGTGTPGISISYPEDEMTLETETVTIEGKITGGNIKKITFNKVEAQIVSQDSTFVLKNFPLTEQTNDIIYRAFDENGIQVQKGTLTLYLSNKKKTVKKPDVISYPVSSKDFKILAPVGNPFKTTERSVKIKGSFAPDLVKSIKVNSYQLQQFKQFGTSWTYNASIDNGNMEEGMNEYLVSYFGPNDELLATTKIYIVKEAETPKPLPTTETTGSGASTPVKPTTSTGANTTNL